MTATHDTTDLVDLIIQDHREFERAFAELERGNQSAEYRRSLVDHLIADLTRHGVAEEQFLYPTAKDKVPGGENIVKHEIAEHSDAEQVMKDLEDADGPEFEKLVVKLIEEVRHHLKDEERDLLPKVKAACSPEELRDLGHAVEAAKKIAPTRPHPDAPDTPPANLLIGPGTGIVDRVRDVLTGRTV